MSSCKEIKQPIAVVSIATRDMDEATFAIRVMESDFSLILQRFDPLGGRARLALRCGTATRHLTRDARVSCFCIIAYKSSVNLSRPDVCRQRDAQPRLERNVLVSTQWAESQPTFDIRFSFSLSS